MLRIMTYVTMLLLLASCKDPLSPRVEMDFNFDWQFSLNNDVGIAMNEFDDSSWEHVNLPHDWSINLPFDSLKGEGCTAYAAGGVGWYRKRFILPELHDKTVYVHFDGIYNHSEVWLNGKRIKTQVSGYAPFYVELLKGLKPAGQENLLAVKVDRSRYLDSRWYSGSGIYRHVTLVLANKLHIPVWGTYVTTSDVSQDKALVNIESQVVNNYSGEKTFDLITKIIAPSGHVVGKVKTEGLSLEPGQQTIKQSIPLAKPKLWGVEHPLLYKAQTNIVSQDNELLDQYVSSFGIRAIEFDATKGFFLNGEGLKIKGLCIHADAGAVGVAVPKGVWRRRLRILKEGGCNALRIAHHPASDELLDLCDEMGFLVQDEFFDEWNYPKDKRLNMNERHNDYISRGYADFFEENAEQDLKNTMLAHRNHPSVFQWSIGNEIEWTYPRNSKATGFFDNMSWEGDYFWSPPPYSAQRIREEYEALPALEHTIGSTAQQLAQWTRELDTTRPVTANCILPSASLETGYADALDVVGFSYRRVMYDYAREHYPDKTVMGTENLPQWHEWKAVEERDFIAGLFLWTGIDYLGEATNMWPVRGMTSGLLDIAGFKKPAYHMYKTLWTEEPYLYICTQTLERSNYKTNASGDVIERYEGSWTKNLWYWPYLNEHWNYKQGDNVVVMVMANTPSVELFLDGKSYGVKYLKDFPDHICKWLVPYTDGTLVAKSGSAKASVTTALSANSMNIVADASVLDADAYDVLHLELMLQDVNNHPVYNDDREVMFEIEGDARIIGIDNGNIANPYAYKGNKVKTQGGKALLIVQSNKGGLGMVKIKASSAGMDDVVTTCKLK